MHNTMALTHKGQGVDDEAALARVALSDPQAFATLYERYHDRVYAYLRTRTGTVEDAADLTQQVFLQAFDALPRYHGPGELFAAWIFRIARNAATDYYRRRRPTVTWDYLPAALQPSAGTDLEARAMRKEDLARLRHLLATLNDDTRELLALRFGAALTVGEIAAIIGKSEAATRKRLARTLHMLTTIWEEHDDDTAH